MARELRIAVGSTNKVKLDACRTAFLAAFPEATVAILPFAAASGVSNQPMTDLETRTGAMNRATAAAALYSASSQGQACDYACGLEGGCEETSRVEVKLTRR